MGGLVLLLKGTEPPDGTRDPYSLVWPGRSRDLF
jgi:hypothetical protein